VLCYVPGVPFDGLSTVAVAGQPIRVSAAASTMPGGCPLGLQEFQFFRDGALVQDWSAKFFFLDAPERRASYRILMRCSSDHDCTSLAGATVDLPVYSGDGGDVTLGVKTAAGVIDASPGLLYDRAGSATTLNWSGPLQSADVYRGAIGGSLSRGQLITGGQRFWQLAGAGCLLSNSSGTAAPGGGWNGTSGPLGQAGDPDPAAGFATFYLVAPQRAALPSPAALGCAAPGLCSVGACGVGGAACLVSGGACGECLRVACNTAAQTAGAQPACPGGGICLDADAISAGDCPPGSDPRKVVREVEAAAVCP